MKEPENITQFKEMAGRILGHLYSTHPTPEVFSSDDFFEDPLEEDEADLFDDTVMYLLENGYLTETQKGVIRLRDKGYEALNKPNPLQTNETLGSGLTNWAKGTASSIATDNISKLAASTLSALYAAFTSAS